jgi:hypothetical protein
MEAQRRNAPFEIVAPWAPRYHRCLVIACHATGRKPTMSRRKRQRRLEERYGSQLTPWMAGSLGLGVLLMLALYLATMPL